MILRTTLALLAALASSAVLAEPIVYCDPVSQYVTQYQKAGDASIVTPGPNLLVEPPGLDADNLVDARNRPVISPRDWICDTGDVREMTQGEKDTRDADQEAADDEASLGLGDRICLTGNVQDISGTEASPVRVVWTVGSPNRARTYEPVNGARLRVLKKGAYDVDVSLITGTDLGLYRITVVRTNGSVNKAHAQGGSLSRKINLDANDVVAIDVFGPSGAPAAPLLSGLGEWCLMLANPR